MVQEKINSSGSTPEFWWIELLPMTTLIPCKFSMSLSFRWSQVISLAAFLMTSALSLEAAERPPLVPSDEIVAIGNRAPLIQYGKHLPGGGHVKGAHSGGWQITHGLAVVAGNKAAEEKVLEQIRSSLEGENCISANGGYPAQHERHMTGLYTILKGTPFWEERLSQEERYKIGLLMKASLIGSAYTTADASYADGAKITTIDGDPNLNRGWNPNFREGMFGALIHAEVFFGGVETIEAILDTYNHGTFVEQLAAAGLNNTYKIFTWAQAHPDSLAPSGTRIEDCVRDYRFQGKRLMGPMELLLFLTRNTFSGEVFCGLNGGEGIDWEGVPTGTIVSGCEELPNKGKLGMLKEFDSRDALGPRSSITYAYDGFRPNLTNLVVVLEGGYWEPNADSRELYDLMSVGIPDLQYKLEHGYRNYAKGKGHPHAFTMDQDYWEISFKTTIPLWTEILQPYLARQLAGVHY